MQVLQWLLKVSRDQKPTKDDHCDVDEASKREETDSKEIVCQNSSRVVRKAPNPEETSLDCRNLRYLALLLSSRGKSRAYFYRTLNKKTLNSLNHRQQHCIRPTKMNKVLPTDGSTTLSLKSSIKEDDHDQKQCGPSDQKKGIVRGGQNNNGKISKNVSKMKELMRWAAASKSEKGGKFGRKGLYLRSRSAAAARTGGFEKELSNDSLKRSVRWIVESPSTACSAQDGCPKKTGHWITTDDEFVVLEL